MSRKKIGVYKKMKRRYIFDKKVFQFFWFKQFSNTANSSIKEWNIFLFSIFLGATVRIIVWSSSSDIFNPMEFLFC